MRKFLFGAAMSLLVGGVAYAEDFIVVGSSDPRIPKSSTFSSGQHIALGQGKSLTLINGAGSLSTISGRAGGVVLPPSVSQGSPTRFAALRSLLERPQARRTFGAMRGGRYGDEACPKVADLVTIDAILAADQNDCNAVAQEAINVYMAKAGKPQ